MLQQSFYRVLQKNAPSENTFFFGISFDPAHPVFKGHFPETAVVPGVFIIQIIKELTENIIGKKLLLSAAKKIKFLLPVLPEKGNVLAINISVTPASAAHTVNATADFLGQSCLKLHASFTEL